MTPRRNGSRVLSIALAAVAVVVLGCGGGGGGARTPVVVIGLDGADWDLLVPWMEQGELPNLKALFDSSAVGDLYTVYPILSPVCWTSAYTGVNPGKHGIFNFEKGDPAKGQTIIETAANRRANPVWTLLSDTGHKVGIMNIPMTFPPDEVDGKMISGFPFPEGDIVYTYPAKLQQQLGDYPLDKLGLSLYTLTPDEILEQIRHAMRARTEVAESWLRSRQFDFNWFVFTASDRVQHFFWHAMDPNHPRYTPEEHAKYGTAILDIWKELDADVGRLLAAAPPDARIMVLSDHGFEAIYWQVNLGNWLPRTEALHWLETHAAPPMEITNGVLRYTLQGGRAGSADRGEFGDLFVKLCRDFRDPNNGKAPFESLFRREDLYAGPMVAKAPDIVFQEAPFYFVTRGVPDSTDLPFVQPVWSTSFTGYHRPEGILALRGPEVKIRTRGSLRERLAAGGDYDRASIMDVTPTLLALDDETIPDQMDGRVLSEALQPGFLTVHPPRIGHVEGFLFDREERQLTPEEREKLRALPYIQ